MKAFGASYNKFRRNPSLAPENMIDELAKMICEAAYKDCKKIQKSKVSKRILISDLEPIAHTVVTFMKASMKKDIGTSELVMFFKAHELLLKVYTKNDKAIYIREQEMVRYDDYNKVINPSSLMLE